jgi:hypothetical protein
MSKAPHISVTRCYQHKPEDCARALALLLNQSVVKVADKPASEPVGRDDAKESKIDCAAESSIPESR